MHTSSIAAKFSQNHTNTTHSAMAPNLNRSGRSPNSGPSAAQPTVSHNRQMQQFYLHKLFDIQSDAEFLPLIPSDPVAMALQMQESMSSPHMGQYQNSNNSPAMQRQDFQRQEAMAFYNASKTRRHSGQFLQQHLFGGKRNDYAQYRGN